MAKSGGSYRWLPDEGGGGSTLGVREKGGLLDEVVQVGPTHKTYNITRELLLEGEGEKTLTVHLMGRCGGVFLYIENAAGDLIAQGDDVLLKVVEDGKEYCQIVQEDLVESLEERFEKTSLSFEWLSDEAHVFG